MTDKINRNDVYSDNAFGSAPVTDAEIRLILELAEDKGGVSEALITSKLGMSPQRAKAALGYLVEKGALTDSGKVKKVRR